MPAWSCGLGNFLVSSSLVHIVRVGNACRYGFGRNNSCRVGLLGCATLGRGDSVISPGFRYDQEGGVSCTYVALTFG